MNSGPMKTKEFLGTLPDVVRQQLPPELSGFHVYPRVSSLTKFYYEHPSVHYEVWIQRRREIVELALHFEGDPESNIRQLEMLQERSDEIRSVLGESIVIAQWDRGWARAHEILPLEPLSDDFLVEVSFKMSAMIRALEPLLRAPAEA